MKRRRGVTLLELLIVISLLSMLSVGMLFALRVGLNAMGRSNAKVMETRRVIGAQRVLDRQFAGFMPVNAECMPQPGGPPGAKIGFFQGEPQTMRFVSSYSLEDAARGYPRILEFQVIPGENSQGVRLIVNEHLYAGPLSTGQFCIGVLPDPLLNATYPRFRPVQIGTRSFVLADKLAYCRFIYREMLPEPLFARWVPVWTQTYWPTGVRIEMAPLAAEGGKLQPVSFTAELHVNSVMQAEYGD